MPIDFWHLIFLFFFEVVHYGGNLKKSEVRNIELEAIARQSIKALCEVICAYIGNICRNSGYFLLPIFWSSHPNVHLSEQTNFGRGEVSVLWNAIYSLNLV